MNNSMSNTSVINGSPVNPTESVFKHEKIEDLVLAILYMRMKDLKKQNASNFMELQKRQEEVAELHQILQSLKTNKDGNGDLDFTNNDEIKSKIKRAKELGVDINEDKTKYTKEQLNELTENIKMTVEDLNVKNDMQLQKVTRLTNEVYEMFQLARSIMKPLHDDKLSKARAMGGR